MTGMRPQEPLQQQPQQPPPQQPLARSHATLSRNQSSAAAFRPLVMARRREGQQPSQRTMVTNLAPLPPSHPASVNRSFGGGGGGLTRSQSQFVAGERARA